MPLISEDGYRPPALFKHAHYSTIVPSQFRKVTGVVYQRERYSTPDGDFFDVDFSTTNSKKIAITLHGFEGNASRPYVLGMVRTLNQMDWDVASLNYRGCSGEINHFLKSYHSGTTDDIHQLVLQLTKQGYEAIALIGFSLGGNLALKYVGEGRQLPNEVKAAIGLSVPIELYPSAIEMGKTKNWVYGWRFKKRLLKKLRSKAHMIEDKAYYKELLNMRSLIHFDDIFTARQFGYSNAVDYYTQNSTKQYLMNIEVPTLLVNALNDSFLPEVCYPLEAAKQSKALFGQFPKYGGHCGFWQKGPTYWSEERTAWFLNEFVS
ncbi:MAG: alpha/beta fold hydrolase [Saprospiraceae bacterium]|nr:alpha/beta fold hydrolase [Saprospiraceae bacterium]